MPELAMIRRPTVLTGSMTVLPAAMVSLVLAWPAVGESREDVSLKDQGIEPALIYDGDIFANVAGGVRRGGAYLGNLALRLTLDGERLIHWPGATLYLEGLSIHGSRPGTFTGDAQGISNMDGPLGWRLEEAWLEQNLFGNRVSLLAGLHDLSVEFYRLASSSLFLNNSFAVGPEFSQSGRFGPSIFPTTALGARLALKPARGVVLRTAVFQDSPLVRPSKTYASQTGNGVLAITEAALLWRPEPKDRPLGQRFRLGRRARLPPYEAKLAVGGWYYTAAFDDLSRIGAQGEPVRHHGSGGFYLLADTVVFQRQENPGARVSLFARLGFGDPRVNRFGAFIGAGLDAKGWVPGRDRDEFGVAVALARNGSHYLERQRLEGVAVERSELTVELTYLMQINRWFALQPDVQYIIGTDTNPSLGHTFAAQLRFELSL